MLVVSGGDRVGLVETGGIWWRLVWTSWDAVVDSENDVNAC